MKTLELKPGDDPLFGWNEDKTKAYIEERPLAQGDLMLLVDLQAGLKEYTLVTVLNPALGRQRRVLIDTAAAWGGTTFYRSGKNCFSPKGQSRMIPPVPEVVDLIRQSTNGKSIHANW